MQSAAEGLGGGGESNPSARVTADHHGRMHLHMSRECENRTRPQMLPKHPAHLEPYSRWLRSESNRH